MNVNHFDQEPLDFASAVALLREARAAIKHLDTELEEFLRRERLILRGMVSENFHIRVSLSPEIITADAFELAQTLLDQYAGRTVAEIDRKMGGPLRRLQEALMHIHYLESHATNRGLPFTPFERRASDAWLYY